MSARSYLIAFLVAAACNHEPTSGIEPDAGPSDGAVDVRVELEGETARAVLPLAGGAVAFLEPTGGALTEVHVARALTWFDAAGAAVTRRAAASGELYVDVVVHPSGEATLFVVDGEGCALRRYSASGELLAQGRLDEMDLVSDPTFEEWPPIIPWNLGGCQPTEIRETGRLAADGEDVYLVNRGGSSGTVLFRFGYAGGEFARTLRRPLFPRHGSGLPIGIVASHRVLRSTHWSYIPRLTVDDAGRAHVLLVVGGGSSPEVWTAFAEEPLPEDTAAILIAVSRAGAVEEVRALPRGLAWPGHVAEIETVRWLRGRVVLAGRVAPAPLPESGFGWDGFIFEVGGLAAKIDVDRGDVISDVDVHGDGWIAAARSGYWQNPRGASISEEARAEVLLLDAAARVTRRIELPQGPRHNGALSVALVGDQVWAGGLANGPGSHSADGNPAMLEADGWVARFRVDQE
jgi:hypothetical protein